MRFALPLCLILSATVCGAEDPEASQPVIRVSLGWPAIDKDGWFGAALRWAGGSSSAPLRFGVQAMELAELMSKTEPGTKLDAIHGWAGYELSPTGPFSAMVFMGLGGATWVEKGPFLQPNSFGDIYVGEKRSGLSALLGLDLGASLWRHAGLSLTGAIMMNKSLGGYTDIKLDVGNW